MVWFSLADSNIMAHYKGAASEGNRAAQLIKKRENAKEELERLKQKISEVSNVYSSAVSQKFY